MSTTITPAKAARQELSGFKGRLIGPRRCRLRRRPRGLQRDDRQAARPDRPVQRCADDVAAVVGFARDHGLLLAVRGGGHNGPGLGTCDDGVVDRPVPAEGRRRSIQRRARFASAAAAPGARSTPRPASTASPRRAGSSRRPASGGLTLGGGMGHLTPQVRADDRQPARGGASCWPAARRSGRAPTSIPTSTGRSAEAAATSASSPRSCSACTRSGTIFGGPTFWALDDGGRSAVGVPRVHLRAAPRELNGFFAYGTVPPAPPFPEALHLRTVAGIVWCYVGSEEEAARRWRR